MWTNFRRLLDGVSSHLGLADAPPMNKNSRGDGDGRGAAGGAAEVAHLDVHGGAGPLGRTRGRALQRLDAARRGKLVSTGTAPGQHRDSSSTGPRR